MPRNSLEIRLPLFISQRKIWEKVMEALSLLEIDGIEAATTTEVYERINQHYPNQSRFRTKIGRGDVFLGLRDLETKGLITHLLVERHDANNNTFTAMGYKRVTVPDAQRNSARQ